MIALPEKILLRVLGCIDTVRASPAVPILFKFCLNRTGRDHFDPTAGGYRQYNTTDRFLLIKRERSDNRPGFPFVRKTRDKTKYTLYFRF